MLMLFRAEYRTTTSIFQRVEQDLNVVVMSSDQSSQSPIGSFGLLGSSRGRVFSSALSEVPAERIPYSALQDDSGPSTRATIHSKAIQTMVAFHCILIPLMLIQPSQPTQDFSDSVAPGDLRCP